jgi:hypothetical protein
MLMALLMLASARTLARSAYALPRRRLLYLLATFIMNKILLSPPALACYRVARMAAEKAGQMLRVGYHALVWSAAQLGSAVQLLARAASRTLMATVDTILALAQRWITNPLAWVLQSLWSVCLKPLVTAVGHVACSLLSHAWLALRTLGSWAFTGLVLPLTRLLQRASRRAWDTLTALLGSLTQLGRDILRRLWLAVGLVSAAGRDHIVLPLARLLWRACRLLWEMFVWVVWHLGNYAAAAFPWLRVVGSLFVMAVFLRPLTRLLLHRVATVQLLGLLPYALAFWASLVIACLMFSVALRHASWTQAFNRLYENLDFNITIQLLEVVVNLAVRAQQLAAGLLRLFWAMASSVLTVLSSLGAALWSSLKPMLWLLSRLLLFAWQSPLLPFVTSLGLIGLAFLLHQRMLTVTLALPAMRPGLDAAVAFLGTGIWAAAEAAFSAVNASATLLLGSYTALEAGLRQDDLLSSVFFAWLFYLCNAAVGRLQLHHFVPWKTAFVPVFTIAVGLTLGPGSLRWYILAACGWTAVSIWVWYAEAQRRERLRVRLEHMQRNRQHVQRAEDLASSLAQQRPKVTFEAQACAICLEDFDEAAAANAGTLEFACGVLSFPFFAPARPSDAVRVLAGTADPHGPPTPESSSHAQVTLPCGHSNFHADCLNTWFQQCPQVRSCPFCRAPVEGSLLQYAF